MPKSAGTLIDETLFDPPIDGTVTQLTAVYRRTSFTNSIASKVIPNTAGEVVAKGEAVKIALREGDFYMVSTPTVRFAMLPVSVVSVSSAALASGKAIGVPSLPPPETQPVAATSKQPRVGSLFGQLKVPYTFEGKVLPAGSYIQIQYDGGNFYVLGGKIWQNPPRISKAAVELVERVEFNPPLSGRINSATPVYKWLPDLFKNPSTLEQGEIFANLNPTVHVGDELSIDAREGNDYIAEIPSRNRVRARIPVAAIDLVAGAPVSSFSITLAPAPQSTDPAAPGYVPPPMSSSERSIIGMLISLGGATSMIALIVGVIIMDARVHKSPPNVASPYNIDPEKWAYDPNTGEYHKYVYKNTEGNLIDTRTYQEIGTARLRLLRDMSQTKSGVVTCSIISLVFDVAVVMMSPSMTATYIISIIVAVVTPFCAVIAAVIWLNKFSELRSERMELPPPPPPPQGVEDVEEQKAYGDAQAAGIDDIHKALGGGGQQTLPGAAQPATGPRFDE